MHKAECRFQLCVRTQYLYVSKGTLPPFDILSTSRSRYRYCVLSSSASRHVGQIRFHEVFEGGALSLLPNLGAQLCHKVLFSRHCTFDEYGRFAHIIYRRSFLTRAYPTMKKNNPHTPILLREALGTEPRVYARYGMPPHSDFPVRCRADRLSRAW